MTDYLEMRFINIEEKDFPAKFRYMLFSRNKKIFLYYRLFL